MCRGMETYASAKTTLLADIRKICKDLMQAKINKQPMSSGLTVRLRSWRRNFRWQKLSRFSLKKILIRCKMKRFHFLKNYKGTSPDLLLGTPLLLKRIIAKPNFLRSHARREKQGFWHYLEFYLEWNMDFLGVSEEDVSDTLLSEVPLSASGALNAFLLIIEPSRYANSQIIPPVRSLLLLSQLPLLFLLSLFLERTSLWRIVFRLISSLWLYSASS